MIPNHYLKVECSKDKETVAIVGDKKGLEILKNNIEYLLSLDFSILPEDISLTVPSWGGEGLSEVTPSEEHILVGHLRLYRCN